MPSKNTHRYLLILLLIGVITSLFIAFRYLAQGEREALENVIQPSPEGEACVRPPLPKGEVYPFDRAIASRSRHSTNFSWVQFVGSGDQRMQVSIENNISLENLSDHELKFHGVSDLGADARLAITAFELCAPARTRIALVNWSGLRCYNKSMQPNLLHCDVLSESADVVVDVTE